jgi:hypothetical protein
MTIWQGGSLFSFTIGSKRWDGYSKQEQNGTVAYDVTPEGTKALEGGE